MASTDADNEEDDYLNMTFTSPPPTKESSLQRIARLKRESAARGSIPSKAIREAQAQQNRETALSTPLDATSTSNKGALLMAKMGFKPGSALGKTEGARTRPIEVQMKDGREGIGMEGEKKRRIREAAEEVEGREKRVKMSAEEYRERNRVEVEERRVEGLVWGAMKVLEKVEGGGGEDGGGEVPLKSVNVLYRPLVKQRLEKERERRMRYDLDQSLSRNWQYEEEEADEKLAFGNVVEEDVEEEDEELQQFEELSAKEKLEKLVEHLREQHHYCFWCKYQYENEQMEGCPGLSEDEHG